MRENADQDNSEYGHFLRSVTMVWFIVHTGMIFLPSFKLHCYIFDKLTSVFSSKIVHDSRYDSNISQIKQEEDEEYIYL